MSESPKPYSIYEDPGYNALRKELKQAVIRGGINLFISAGDAIPHIIPVFGHGGEGLSFATDISKIARISLNMFRLKWKLDLTPDVGYSALITEPIDWAAGSLLPWSSHALETSLQLKHDAQRFWRFHQVHRLDRKGVDHEEIKEFLYAASRKDRIFEELSNKLNVTPPLSDLSSEEILGLVPKPLL